MPSDGALLPHFRPGEEPDDESQHGQKNDEQCPEHFLACAYTTLKDVHDGPDVRNKDDQPPKAIHFSKHDYLLKAGQVQTRGVMVIKVAVFRAVTQRHNLGSAPAQLG
jgi:hypothetical protein